MAFVDDLVQCLQQSGINVDRSALPDEGTFQQAFDYLKNWFSSLSQVEQAAFDAATRDGNPSAQLLAQQNVNVAPALPGLLAAFDAVSGLPLSYALSYTDQCVANALQSSGSGS